LGSLLKINSPTSNSQGESSVDTFERLTCLEWELPRVAVAVGARAGLQVLNE